MPDDEETYSEAQERAAGDVDPGEPVDMLSKEQGRACHACGRLDTPVYYKDLHFCSATCCGIYAAGIEGDNQQFETPKILFGIVAEHQAAQRIGGDLTRALGLLNLREPK